MLRVIFLVILNVRLGVFTVVNVKIQWQRSRMWMPVTGYSERDSGNTSDGAGAGSVMVPSGRRDFSLLLSAHNGSGTRRASYSVGTWVIPRGKAAEATNLHLLRRLRMKGSIPLLPLDAFVACMWIIWYSTIVSDKLAVYLQIQQQSPGNVRNC